MDAFSNAVVTAWVLGWMGAVGVWMPTAALGPAPNRRLAEEMGPALVWTWLAIAIATPLMAAVRGFNWLTALLAAVLWPVALWVFRHRGEYRPAFRALIRSLVFQFVVPRRRRGPSSGGPSRLFRLRTAGAEAAMTVMPLAAAPLFAWAPSDPRLPVPADFDTLWRTRQLLAGRGVWDPLASLVAVLSRVAATDVVTVTLTVRFALIGLTAAAAGIGIAGLCRNRWAGIAAAAAVVVFAPVAATGAWAIALVSIIGLTALTRWIRDERARDGWHAAAAAALVAGLLPFAEAPAVLAARIAGPQYLEHASASRETRRLERTAGDGWLLVAPPEQQLEIEREGGSYDLARFVARFEDRAGQPGFRFDLPGRHLYVMVEKRPFDVGEAAQGVQFVANQPAAYRVPQERWRLERRAMRLCEDYRRTHAGAIIDYDDADIRVYRFEL